MGEDALRTGMPYSIVCYEFLYALCRAHIKVHYKANKMDFPIYAFQCQLMEHSVARPPSHSFNLSLLIVYIQCVFSFAIFLIFLLCASAVFFFLLRIQCKRVLFVRTICSRSLSFCLLYNMDMYMTH